MQKIITPSVMDVIGLLKNTLSVMNPNSYDQLTNYISGRWSISMSFEVCYTGSTTHYDLWGSSPRTKGDKFFDKMDALAKEYKKLNSDKEEAVDEEKENAFKIANAAAKKALSEKYPDGRYELIYFDEDNIENKFLEKGVDEKSDEIVKLCREYFTHEVKCEGGIGHLLDYEEQDIHGEISVDNEDLEMSGEWYEDDYENQEDEITAKSDEIHEQDWCVLYYVQYKSAWVANIEEGEFDKKKLKWKDKVIHYGDNPVNEDVAGARPIAEEIYVVVDGQTYDL